MIDKSTMYRITLPDIARSSRVIKCCGALRAILPKDVTMQSTMYRITLPDIARSSRVIKCCGALRAILPKDVTMQVIIKWYGVRNAPGTQELTPEQEWSMFANLLYSLIGYDLERMSLPRRSDDHGENSEVATKKQRTSSDGTQDDWDYLLNSKLHKNYGNTLASLLNLPQTKSDSKTRPGLSRKKSQNDDKTQFNANALLFPYTAQVLFAFHLLYEDTKLNTLLLHELQPLSSFLYQLAKDLKLDKYVTHYWLDFPTGLCLEYEEQESQMTEGCQKRLLQPSYFSTEPPSVFAYVNSMLKDEDAGVYPYLVDVNEMSKNIVEIVSVSTNTRGRAQNISAPPSSTPRAPAAAAPAPAAIMAERGITQTDIDRLSPCIRLLLLSIQSSCRGLPLAVPEIMAQNLPSSDVSDIETAYTLDRRPDTDRSEDKEAEPATGMEHLNTKLLRLLYPKDHRMTEVFNLLQSSIPISINLTQRPEVSDHDFLEEQEKYLFAVSSRTTALPIARGMVTLRTIPWGGIPPDAAPPPLTVWGRGPAPRRAAVQLAAPPSRAWPSFHNGCAHALANRETLLTGTVDMSHEHAGYLLGLGLNGQLKDMPFMHIYIIVSKLGLTDFNRSAISQCVRIGGVLDPLKPRPILVRFSNPSLRSQVWDTKKHLKASPIVIREFLTRTRQHIFIRARKHFGIRACWTRNGAIFVQLPDSSRVKIVSELELNELCSKHPAVAPAAPAHKPPGSKPAPKPASSRVVTPTQSSAPKSSAAQPAPTTRSKAAAAQKDKR
ncbi:unnamed protein product [Plutella xylostella]|uniref:(diamondback moth) hypothetical protein n=1 Tax=Plutella xylostella TaxID=51655 RepID=A0A8S4G384_PLUXY|nr:unnamed protein product [Plutella xylostella]